MSKFSARDSGGGSANKLKVSHCVARLEGSWSFFANLFYLALELEYAQEAI
jgi:hypothetical protein